MGLNNLFRTRGYREGASLVVVGVLMNLALIASFPQVKNYFIDRTHTEHRATLRLVTGGVDQAMQRFGPLPELISDDPEFKRLLQDPTNQGIVPFMNQKLRLTAQAVDASDIYLMDTDGVTIAASNYREDHTFVGRDFSYRPYFQDALTGEAAQFHALGTTSGEPGFFFAAPVLDGIDVIGVLALKVSTDQIESGWAAEGREIIVADGNGIVFLSSNPDLRYRALAPLSDGVRDRIAATKQFPLELIEPLSAAANVIKPGSVKLQFTDALNSETFLADSRAVALPGWHAVIISPMSRITSQAIYALAFCLLGTLVLTLAALLVVQSRARVDERMRAEQAQRELLERTVKERTAELRSVNTNLQTEVLERKHAEDRLRRTQKELVQAGKLAALGHMSAALSHEINQPLTAVKSYANNAVAFLDRQQVEKAQANLSTISKLVDRMATISGHLRNFARRPGDQLRAVDIGKVIEDAIKLIEPLATSRKADIRFVAPSPKIWAVGGTLRLQQVVVNLLTNALDAMAGCDTCLIDVSIELKEQTVAIVIRDYGPGLAADATDQVFEPFYTTKGTGEGMGLGLSISFNIIEDFGGKLSAQNHPDGGAVFQVTLQRTTADTTTIPSLVAE